MSRVALVQPVDQDFALIGFSASEVFAYAEKMKYAIERATQALIEVSQYAMLIQSSVDIAPTPDNLQERKQAREQKKQIEQSYGWTPSVINFYAKLAPHFPENIDNLFSLDFNTIKSLCCEKFNPILERLEGDRLTIVEVREQMREINQANKQPKQPAPALEWKRSKGGDRSLTIRLNDAEAGDEFEAKYKASGQPLPLFLRSLLRGQVDTWQQANDDLTQYLDNQVAKTDEIAQIERQIAGCDRLIAQYADSTNASEIMVRRVAIEDKLRLENQLKQLLAVAA